MEEESCANEETRVMLISKAEHLCLEDSMNIIPIWEGPTFISFQNLTELTVSNCGRLKYMFPNTVMKSSPCLEYLRIFDCEEMEEMMSSSSSEEKHNHFPNESSNSLLCFPQLKLLGVERCRKLKWLFPFMPSTQLLPQLTYMWIKECPQLNGLFNCKFEVGEQAIHYNNLLPNLTSLELDNCPTTPAELAALHKRKRLWQTCRDFVAKKRRRLA